MSKQVNLQKEQPKSEIKKGIKGDVLILIAVLGACSVSFFSSSFAFQERSSYAGYEPIKDLSWLNEFYPLSEMLTIDHWEKNPIRKFDSVGIILNNGIYHPVNIFQYGIACYDVYKRTGDKTYKEKFLKQANYLTDTSKYTTFPDRTIGFPYKVTYRDLKPGWYSGLAQGEAMMYLLRHYDLTKDKSLLPILFNVKDFMLKPVDKGGALLDEGDGLYWIEEYPNSKLKTHVLNGFITSITALFEYCKVFPQDLKAKEILNGCLLNLKASLKKFDTGSWVYYDNGTERQPNPNWYMKTNAYQMRLLYKYTGDDFYKTYYYLLSTYSYEKNISGMVGCIVNNYNLSVPCVLKSGGWYMTGMTMQPIILKKQVKRISINGSLDTAGVSRIIDNNLKTSYAVNTETVKKNSFFIELKFDTSIAVSKISIETAAPNLDASKTEIQYKLKDSNKWITLKSKSTELKDLKVSATFNEISFDEVKIFLQTISDTGKVVLNELSFFKSTKSQTPLFSHYLSDAMEITNPSFNVSFSIRGTNDFIVFYKSAPTKEGLSKLRWDEKNISTKPLTVIKTKEKFYQFLFVYKVETEFSGFKDFKVQ